MEGSNRPLSGPEGHGKEGLMEPDIFCDQEIDLIEFENIGPLPVNTSKEDQFARNEALNGRKSGYKKDFYTIQIDKEPKPGLSHIRGSNRDKQMPKYQQCVSRSNKGDENYENRHNAERRPPTIDNHTENQKDLENRGLALGQARNGKKAVLPESDFEDGDEETRRRLLDKEPNHVSQEPKSNEGVESRQTFPKTHNTSSTPTELTYKVVKPKQFILASRESNELHLKEESK